MTAAAEELYCLLVPLADDRLLVPRSSVTEVINYQAPTPMEGAPPWYLGTVAWADGECRSSRSRLRADATRRAPAGARAWW